MVFFRLVQERGTKKTVSPGGDEPHTSPYVAHRRADLNVLGSIPYGHSELFLFHVLGMTKKTSLHKRIVITLRIP